MGNDKNISGNPPKVNQPQQPKTVNVREVEKSSNGTIRIVSNTPDTDKPYPGTGIESNKKQEVQNICDDFYKAIDGLGTNNKLFEATVKKLTADNILEVFEEWNKTYGKQYKESFFTSFLGDASEKQKKDLIPHMQKCFADRWHDKNTDNAIRRRLENITLDYRKCIGPRNGERIKYVVLEYLVNPPPKDDDKHGFMMGSYK